MKGKDQEDEIKSELNDRQVRFCQEYIIDLNGTRAYMTAYNTKDYEGAKASASRLLTNVNVKACIKKMQSDLEEQAGITRLRVLLEHKKLAFSSIAHLHQTWIKRKDFEELTDDQRSCISEIDTKVQKEKRDDEEVTVEYVKVKLYDKQKALEAISRMMGYNEPEKIDLSSKGESLKGMSTEELIQRSKAFRTITENE